MVGKEGSRNMPLGERAARLAVTRSSRSTSVIDDDVDVDDVDVTLELSAFFPNPVPDCALTAAAVVADAVDCGECNLCNSSSNHARNSDSAAPSRK